MKEKIEIDGLEFSRYSLLNRCREIDWVRISMNLLIGILIMIICHPRLLLSIVVWFALILVVLLNIIILNRIHEILLKIDRILKNGKIITSKVISEMSIRRLQWPLLFGEVELHSSYFDPQQNKNNMFCYKGVARGASISNLEEVKVLVNKDDYNDYFVLLIEELDINISGNKFDAFSRMLNYVLFYGFVLWIAFGVK